VPEVGVVPATELPGSAWRVWHSALLRSTGFPAEGLDRLAAPELAAAADAHLAGTMDEAEFDALFAETVGASADKLRAIAADPMFREAITWQNLTALEALDGLVRSGPDAKRNNKLREREWSVTRYWQRYCGKNDSIGFFGPTCWVTIDPAEPDAARGGPGPGLLRERKVEYEWWALVAYADSLAADPEIRQWLPVYRQPHQSLVDIEVRRPLAAPVKLTTAEAALLSACDGRPAVRVADAVAADPDSPLRKRSDALLALDRLVGLGVLRWGIDLPINQSAEERLRESLAGLPDGTVRSRATAGLIRLDAARDAVAAAAGDPDALRTALIGFDREFAAITGLPPRQGLGQMYAGRALCYEDTTRDFDLVLGEPVVAALAGPLDVLLQSLRWITAAIAEAYHAALRDLHAELAAELGTPHVPMGELWFLVQGLLFGRGERPMDTLMADFARRWSALFGLDTVPPGTHRVSVASEDLADMVAFAFPAERPGWAAGRLHSPDLILCADGFEALARGEFTAVVGEIHAAWLTCSIEFMVRRHADPDALAAAVTRDVGSRTVPLYPVDWPRFTARVADGLVRPSDWHLAFAAAPPPSRGSVVPITTLTVSDVDGVLVATTPDGWRRPVLELISELLSGLAADAYKLVSPAAHTPRVTMDRLVVCRETWRTTLGATGLFKVRGERDRYLAVRRWRSALGLPERVFVRCGTELKPCYVDLGSPAFVATFCAMLRAAHRAGGDDVELVITEMLPDTKDAWVPDAAGRRYLSELRLTLCDPVPATVSWTDDGTMEDR